MVAAGDGAETRPVPGGCESHDSKDYNHTFPRPLLQYLPNPGARGKLIFSILPIQDLSGDRCAALSGIHFRAAARTPMDFDQLHTFLEIVRLKSFSKAAQRQAEQIARRK